MPLSEFQLINQFFDFQPSDASVIKGVGDDTAVLEFSEESDLLWTVDTLVEGIHFFADISPEDLAYKAVAVNLSDIAAMGGQGKWLTLSLGLTVSSSPWLEAFSQALQKCLKEFKLSLVGGDTVRSPKTSLTVSIIGQCPKGKAVLRSNAQVDDGIYVTGTLGDAALALKLIATKQECADFLWGRLHRPTPRLKEGRLIGQYGHAALDVSDGLLADLNHILEQSQKSARLFAQQIPMSKQVSSHLDQHAEDWNLILAGGDDYELCFTLPVAREQAFLHAWQQQGLAPVSKIGTIEADREDKIILVDRNGELIHTKALGFKHF